MLNHNHGRPDGATTAEVIDLFARKRDRLGKKFGAIHPALRPQEAQNGPATVIPIRAGRKWRASRGD